MSTIERLREIAGVMREVGATRFSCDGLEVELGPARAPDAPPADGETVPIVCPCGHDLDVEHNDTGCLRGCAVEKCEVPK